MLRCDGGKPFGVLINGRWLEVFCREKRCRKPGFQTVHTFDLLTGRKVTDYRAIEQAAT